MLIKTSILRFTFDDFASLFSERTKVFSELTADGYGNLWKLCIQPGGNPENGEGEMENPYVGLLLKSGADSFFARLTFILRDALGKVYHEVSPRPVHIQKGSEVGNTGYIKRSKILVGGALHIDVQLQFRPGEESLHKPPSSLAIRMLQVLEVGKGDVSFMVGDEVVTAHKDIIQVNAPVLFDFCEGINGSPIPINGVTPEIFRIVLRYVYAEQVPDTTTISSRGKTIIDVANRLGVVGLKIAVETILVESMMIVKSNAAYWLVFADAKTCPLLKEYAMSFCVVRARDMINSDTSEKLKKSPNLMGELVSEVARRSDGDNRYNDGSDASVTDLRKQLRSKGLDVDGSKEMLVARLRGSNKRQRSE